MPRPRVNMASVATASFAAGPIFVLSLGMASFILAPGRVIPVPAMEMESVPGLLVGTVFGTGVVALFGLILSIIPNMIGASVMTWMCHNNVAFQLPLMWALVGGLVGSLPFTLGNLWYDKGSITAGIAFTTTGMLCTLLCRRRVRWDGPAPPPIRHGPSRPA